MAKQLIMIRRKFQTYGAFGQATVQDVFSAKELEGALILKTNWMSSSYVENLGNGKFKLSPLPAPAQLAPIYGMLPYDVDHDGRLDLIMIGNDYGMELLQGRADAFNGLVLKNTGNGQFWPAELEESHLMVPHDARALTRIALAGKKEAILATQNRGDLMVFAVKNQPERLIPLDKSEVCAEITYRNGQKQLREFYWGSSFLSQEPRNIEMDAAMNEIAFFDRAHHLTRKVIR
jgi:hypothetical protein